MIYMKQFTHPYPVSLCHPAREPRFQNMPQFLQTLCHWFHFVKVIHVFFHLHKSLAQHFGTDLSN